MLSWLFNVLMSDAYGITFTIKRLTCAILMAYLIAVSFCVFLLAIKRFSDNSVSDLVADTKIYFK